MFVRWSKLLGGTSPTRSEEVLIALLFLCFYSPPVNKDMCFFSFNDTERVRGTG